MPLRVLIVAPSSRFVGGQAVQAARLLECLRQAPGLRVDLQHIDPPLPPGLNWLRRVKYVRSAVNLLVFVSHLLWRIPRYDIIHAFSAGLTAYLLCTVPVILVGRLYGRKVIVNYRDGRAGDHLRRSHVARPTLRMADAVVSPSEYLVGLFAASGIPAMCIPNIIDPDRFVYRQRSRIRPVFLTNRMLDPLYNVDCVLRAFALVQRRYPEARLTVAHDGPSRRHLEELCSELGLRNTEFVGHVPVSRIPALYDSADLYLMSPWLDCMPGTLLECFASGIPAISTNVGGVPYIIADGQTGFLVEPGDHEAMAACALRLLSDPDLVEAVTRRARDELAKYSFPLVRDAWLALYRRLSPGSGNAES
ncbi:MAG: glycosyltransferase family 4 protein [Bryobacteraceae bacterium]